MARPPHRELEPEQLLLQQPLQFDIQLDRAQRAFVRGRKHLDVADQIVAEPFLEHFIEQEQQHAPHVAAVGELVDDVPRPPRADLDLRSGPHFAGQDRRWSSPSARRPDG